MNVYVIVSIVIAAYAVGILLTLAVATAWHDIQNGYFYADFKPDDMETLYAVFWPFMLIVLIWYIPSKWICTKIYDIIMSCYIKRRSKHGSKNEQR